MKAAGPVFILVLLLVVAALFGLSELSSSQAKLTNAEANLAYSRGAAEALIIRANGQARLDSAAASAILAAANLPYFTLTMAFILGVVILAMFGAVLVIYLTRRPPQLPAQLERQTIMLLPAGTQPGQVWSRVRQLPKEVQCLLPSDVPTVGRK